MQIGDTYEYKNVVTKEITAGALGSGGQIGRAHV